jgi:Type IV secretion system pilin
MKYIFSFILPSLLLSEVAFATRIGIGTVPENSLIKDGTSKSWGLIEILQFIETILLKVALPLVIVGSFLYIAYELFLAEGNEEKMKKAWKSVTYSVIGIICIALAYAVVSLVSRLSI